MCLACTLGDANRDGDTGDGAITRKRFPRDQHWRRSVRGRPWPGKNTTGPHFSQHEASCGAGRHFRMLVVRLDHSRRVFFASKHARACVARALLVISPHVLDKPHIFTTTVTASSAKNKAPTCCCRLASACATARSFSGPHSVTVRQLVLCARYWLP